MTRLKRTSSTLPKTVEAVVTKEIVSASKALLRSRSRSFVRGVASRRVGRSRSRGRSRSHRRERTSTHSRRTSKPAVRSYNDAINRVLGGSIYQSLLVAAFGASIAYTLAQQRILAMTLKKHIRDTLVSAPPPPPPPASSTSTAIETTLFVANIAWTGLSTLSLLYDIAAPMPWGPVNVLLDGIGVTMKVPVGLQKALKWRRVLFRRH